MGRTAKARAFQRVRRKDHDAAHRSLARVGVESLSDQLFRNLSGGQQQRVLLARTLAADPEVLVLDEPTAGMDVASEAATIEFLRALNRDHRVTIAIVSHRLSLVVNLADCVMLIGNQSALFGSLDEVVQEGPLSELYGVPVHVGTVAGKTTLVVGLPGADNV
jgi:ABC-type Mn2+/Zn2+ transport system ATPase subunit